MDISKDTDIPVILGRPFMLSASCIVEMQKIDFDLFVEDKPAPEDNVCLQVMREGQEVLKVRTKT